MSRSSLDRKRKAVTRDSPEAEKVALSDGSADEDDFAGALLNGDIGLDDELNESDSEASLDADEGQSDLGSESEIASGLFGSADELDSDEVPSEEEEEEEEDTPANGEAEYEVVKDANGNERYIYKPVDPVYDSDDSDAPPTTNTIGNIPLSFYDSYPHIGYDINGKKVARPAKGAALDALLDSIEIPKGWTGLTDPATGRPLELTQEELEVLRKVQMNEVPEDGFDPYPATIEYFTSKTETMPLSAAPEPKRRFVPSKHEATRVMKIVKAIREGRIMPHKPASAREKEEEEDEELGSRVVRYDIWADEAPRPDHPMNIPAPKLPPPGFAESYHPPPEYLPDKKEKEEWENADEEDREKDFLPEDHDALRKVPAYELFVKEKFERCLDLYLAPRVRKSKLNIDPESLLPKLPDPDELRPFPSICATIFRGAQGRVRSLAIDPTGIWLASGGDDGTLRVWELLTGRQMWSIKLEKDEAINVVRWRPGRDAAIISAAAGETVYLVVPEDLLDPETDSASRALLDQGFGYAAKSSDGKAPKSSSSAIKWTRPASTRLQSGGVCLTVPLRKTVQGISWHRRGEYFSTVSPQAQSSAVAIHSLSKHLTQFPFRRLKGLAQAAHFHPSKPVLLVATQRSIRCYDLAQQELVKIIQPGARWISNFDIHPRDGNHVVVGSYDKRLLWHDLELSARPYKTLRYHTKAIRAVRFHPSGALPLFADASDDGSVQVFHGKVVDDALENATIVPLKVLRGHTVTGGLGVMDLDWHPREPWVVSAGSDGTCRLWM